MKRVRCRAAPCSHTAPDRHLAVRRPVTTYLVVLNFAILPSLQQFNKVLAYEVRMLMTDKLQLEDGTQLVVPRRFVVKFIASWGFRSIPMKRRKTQACAGRSIMNS